MRCYSPRTKSSLWHYQVESGIQHEKEKKASKCFNNDTASYLKPVQLSPHKNKEHHTSCLNRRDMQDVTKWWEMKQPLKQL